jgi:hypothetical protein
LPETIGIIDGMPGLMAKGLDDFFVCRDIPFKLPQLRGTIIERNADRNFLVHTAPFIPEIEIGPEKNLMRLELPLQLIKAMAQTLIHIEVQVTDPGGQKFLVIDFVHFLKSPGLNLPDGHSNF